MKFALFVSILYFPQVEVIGLPVKDVDLFCAPAAVSEVVFSCGTHPYSSEQANRTVTEAFVTFRAEKVWNLDSVRGNAGNEDSERVDFPSYAIK